MTSAALTSRRFYIKTSYRYDVLSEGNHHERRSIEARYGLLRAGIAKAIRLKVAHTHRSMPDIVNDAVRLALRDQEDLAAFEDRVAEPVTSHEALLKDLKAHSKL